MQNASVGSNVASTPSALRTKHPRRTNTTAWPCAGPSSSPRRCACRQATSVMRIPSRSRIVRPESISVLSQTGTNVQGRTRARGQAADMPALVILLAGQAMVSMDVSILVVATPSLATDLHVSPGELQLVVAAYTVAFGALVVTGSRLGDVLGRRRAFLAGLAAFTTCSLAGGLAPDPEALIGARALQGTAAALMTPQVLSIIQVEVDGERRTRAIGAYSMILAVGVAAGQVLGGMLVSAHVVGAAWRPALLINAPVGAVLLAAGRRCLPRTAPLAAARLDLGGVALLSTAMAALIVPLTLGREAGWPAWASVSLAASAVAAAAFVAHERRVRAGGRRPLLALELLRVPGGGAGIGAVLLVMSCYAGFLLSLTLHLQDGLRFSALHSGLVFAAYACGFAAASLSWGRVPPSAQPGLPVIGPLAMGAALLAVGVTAMVGSDHASDASGLILTASLVGQVLGVAAFAGVYLDAVKAGSPDALGITTGALAGALTLTAVLGWCVARAWRSAEVGRRPRAWP